MSASDRTPGPASKDRRASAQSLLRRSCPETLSTTCVEKAGETLASRPTLKGKDTSSKACTSSSPYNLKQVKPSRATRSEEHTSELQSLMRISYAVFCLKKKKINNKTNLNKTTPNTYNI